MENLNSIKILNEFGTYSIWHIYEECEQYYKISLSTNMALITTVNKSKVYKADDSYLYSDYTIKNKENFNFGFTSFGTINLS